MGIDLGANRNIGPYQLTGELGRGAMAQVWRAWDPNLEREVAIKEPLFAPGYSDAVIEEMGRRFVTEGRTAARLNHPNIVTIYAADVWDGRPAIVMELIDGVTLTQYMSNGPVPPQQALTILDQLLDAVDYAHRMGVIHRDIKPDNIFVTSTGLVKLADFGIARLDGAPAAMGTMLGTVLGTPGYMSPEQAVGQPVDGRSDLFSVGVIAYELLTGSNPFGALDGSDPTTVIYRTVHEPVRELAPSVTANLQVDLRPAVQAALCKQPQGRPATAADFKAMLHGQLQAPTYGVGQGQTIDSWQGNGPAATYGFENGWSSSVSPVAVPAKKTSTWLPYALVAGVCTLVLAFVFLNAIKGGAHGGGMSSAPVAVDQPTEEESDTSTGDSSKKKTTSKKTNNSSEKNDSGSQSGSSTQSEEIAPVEKPDTTGHATVIDPDVAGPDDYVLQDTSYHVYTYEEANELTNKQLYYARNEIYARYHRGFMDPDLVNYFNSKSWYYEELTAEQWNDIYGAESAGSPCNDAEKSNWQLFYQIEKERNSELLDNWKVYYEQ